MIMNNKTELKNLSQVEIVDVFDGINADNRTILIPIGFPGAGKSMFLSSLMYYCEEYTDKLWVEETDMLYPYNRGELSKKIMVDFLKNKRGIPTTPTGSIDLIGLKINPHKDVPEVKIALLDLAGEDLKNAAINSATQGVLDDKIEGILHGCSGGKPIFCLITPYQPVIGDKEEDDLHYRFINYIKQKFPKLFKVSKFIVIVSQWDKVIDDNLKEESYLKNQRPKLYNLISNKDFPVYYLAYSVGEIRNLKDSNGEHIVHISKINFSYPNRFWNRLYTVITGKDLENLSWWERLVK